MDAGDPEAIAACFADGFSTSYTTPGGDRVHVAPEDVPGWIRGWVATVDDMTHAIECMVADGGEVMATVTYSGIHAGEVFGVEPTGSREVEEWLYFEVVDEGIVDLAWLGDDVGLLRQLGDSVAPTA